MKLKAKNLIFLIKTLWQALRQSNNTESFKGYTKNLFWLTPTVRETAP